MAKLPKPGTKAQRRWIRGLWVGKLDRDNTNIILTECGALSVRSVRRLPAEAQANRTLMGSAAGVPWALRQGRVLREPPPMVAQPVVLPAPTVEATAAEEPDEYRELEVRGHRGFPPRRRNRGPGLGARRPSASEPEHCTSRCGFSRQLGGSSAKATVPHGTW